MRGSWRVKLFAKCERLSGIVVVNAKSVMSADSVRNMARLDDVDPVNDAKSSASSAGASGKQRCKKNDRYAVWHHRPNETELSHRWRERALLRILVLKSSKSYPSERPAVRCHEGL